MNAAPLLRTITLSLARPCGANILTSLNLPPGLMELAPLGDSNRIRLTYDLRQTSLAQLEGWLATAGTPLSPALLARWYRQWLAFKDDNRLDQAKIVHQCCNVPPKGK